MTKAILVVSGKGGTGKTTIATNLARCLDNSVLADVDIDSSNALSVMGSKEKSKITGGRTIEPVEVDGVEVYSVEALFRDSTFSIAGESVRDIIDRIVHHSVRREPEWLVLDCAPGLSDTFRGIVEALSKREIPKAAIIVSQPNAVTDAARVVKVCHHTFLPILGFIENMSGTEEGDFAPFGRGKVEKFCERLGGKFIGRIPLTSPERRDEVVKPIVEDATLLMESNSFKHVRDKSGGNWIINFIRGLKGGIEELNERVDIAKLQDEFGLEESVDIKLEFTDESVLDFITEKEFYFGIHDGELKYVRNPEIVGGGIKIPSKEFRDGLRFKRECMDAVTGEMEEMDYSLMDAAKLGFAEIWREEDLDLNVSAWEMLMVLEYIMREYIEVQEVKSIGKDVI